jgi:Helicase associated domain (HA2), ratchet-like
MCVCVCVCVCVCLLLGVASCVCVCVCVLARVFCVHVDTRMLCIACVRCMCVCVYAWRIHGCICVHTRYVPVRLFVWTACGAVCDLSLSHAYTSAQRLHTPTYLLNVSTSPPQHHSQMATFLPVWVSKASAAQRRGRAGRVREGVCYRLYTSERYANMRAYQVPEILRSPLEEVVLQVTELGFGDVYKFLANAVDPPDVQAIANAIELLHSLAAVEEEGQSDVDMMSASGGGALHTGASSMPVPSSSSSFCPSSSSSSSTSSSSYSSTAPSSSSTSASTSTSTSTSTSISRSSTEDAPSLPGGLLRLTPLGKHLAHLPVDARLGKMLILGATMGCLDPVLTIAAALSARSPFVTRLHEQQQTDRAKLMFAANSRSDHIAYLRAFQEWQR